MLLLKSHAPVLQEAEKTGKTIELANRLVGGLASENVRWAESVENFKRQEQTLPGDVLLITAFISYVGCFTKSYRLDLMDNYWMPILKVRLRTETSLERQTSLFRVFKNEN